VCRDLIGRARGLHAERMVVRKETAPVERVRLDKGTVTENRTVSNDVRKERIKLQDEFGASRRRYHQGRHPKGKR
jgi:stress response protein YsnF